MQSADEGLLCDQDMLAERACRLQFNIMRCRLASLVQAMFVWPRAFAALLSENEDDVSWALEGARRGHVAFVACSKSTLPWCKGIVKESCLQWTLSKEVMAELDAVGFKECALVAQLNGPLLKHKSCLGTPPN